MPKNLIKKIVSKEDISNTCINMTTAWLAGKVANTVSNAVFHFNLNQYNSIDHLVIGVGIGTLAYRKAGGGFKGIAAGVITATAFSALWESFENGYVFHTNVFKDKESLIDTMSDVAVVYAGNILGFLAEKAKRYAGRKKKD